MAVITFPSDLYALKMSWGVKRNYIKSSSSFGSQMLEVASPQWTVSIDANDCNDEVAGRWQALVMQLKGGVNQLAMWNLMRPAPLGTARGNIWMDTAAAGATSAGVNGTTANANKTLKRGDWLGLGTGTGQQVIMITQDVTLNASGVGTINFENPLRVANTGQYLVWDKPKALFRTEDANVSWDYSTNIVSGFSQSFIEDWRP